MNRPGINRPEAKPEIRAILFDLGGVLLRTDDTRPRTRLARRLGLTRRELEEIVFDSPTAKAAEVGQASVEEVWISVCRRLGRPVTEIPTLEREFFDGDTVDFRLIHLIRGLRPKYLTGLLSNSWFSDMARTLRETLLIPADTFDVVISSSAVKIAKPDPAIYHLAVERLKVEPAQAIFVDDNERNIKGAQFAGLQTIRFLNTNQLIQALGAAIPLPPDSAA